MREGLISLSDDVEGAAAAKSKKSSQKKDVKRLPSANTSDDIDKMKVSIATMSVLTFDPFVVCFVVCFVICGCSLVASIVNNMNHFLREQTDQNSGCLLPGYTKSELHWNIRGMILRF